MNSTDMVICGMWRGGGRCVRGCCISLVGEVICAVLRHHKNLLKYGLETVVALSPRVFPYARQLLCFDIER